MLYVLLGLFAAFLAVILIRAAMFKPKPQPPVSEEAVSFDRLRFAEEASALIAQRSREVLLELLR